MGFVPIVGNWFYDTGIAGGSYYLSYGLLGIAPAAIMYRTGAMVFLDMSGQV